MKKVKSEKVRPISDKDSWKKLGMDLADTPSLLLLGLVDKKKRRCFLMNDDDRNNFIFRARALKAIDRAIRDAKPTGGTE